MAKQLLYGDEARKKLKTGIDALARAVVVTLGPKGRNVGLEKKWGSPSVIHDGVTVAKEIDLADPFENMGAQLVKEAASKTNDVAGDGTTTATLLAKSIIDEGIKQLTSGANPMILRRGLEKGLEVLVAEVKKIAKPIKSKEEKEQVATVSAADAEIGKMIADALEHVGDSGVVTVEEGKGLKMEVEYKEGMMIDKGYASPYFVTNADRMEAVVESPYILITDQKVSSINDILKMLEELVKVTKNLVIIADDVDGEALATMVVNKIRGILNTIGGQVISEEIGRKLDSVRVEDLGRADRIVSGKEETVIVGGKGSREAINDRVIIIKKQIDETDSDFDREKLEERLAKLSGGVAVINVGAATETEMKEKKARVEDALHATKAAVEEGIVPGGGVVFLRARKALDYLKLEGEEKAGVDILYRALEQPARLIVENAGVDSGWVVREIEAKDNQVGFDVLTMKFEDMVKMGIVDPAKVARSALQNAVSVASMVLSTETLVADLPEKKEAAMPSMPGGGMGGGMDY